MTEIVRRCYAGRGDGSCRLSSGLVGWGCRLITCLPSEVPTTERAKARLFSKVYNYASAVGVLDCPCYDESIIDRTLSDKKELEGMVKVESPSQTDLLSDLIYDYCI